MVRAMEQTAPTLLLVDDEEFILSAIKRLLRRDGYRILTAESGQEGLRLLETTPVDVIVSDQRMPGMTGVEFLREARKRYPKTIRMVLSGYTELQSVTDAINEGAVYKFMTKPWDDEHLRANIVEAFRQRALETENQRLHDELHIAHASLVKAHAQMADLVRQQQKRLVQDEVVMGVSHEIFDAVAVPVIGVDGGGMVVLINAAAQQFFPSAVPGTQIQSVDGLEFFAQGPMALLGQGFLALRSGGRGWTVSVQRVGGRSQSQGGLLTFIPVQEEKPCP
jgi:CheY-like chemotaxis protein